MSNAFLFPQEEFSGEFTEELSFRVAALEVFNWGPFHGKHTCAICAEGTAIIGPTGSGKTTLLDAMVTLLVQQPKYNLASTGGVVSDRDLISYVRGAFAEASGEAEASHVARPGKTVTGLAVRYRSETECLTIGAVLWLDGTGSAAEDLKRFWFVGSGEQDYLDLLLEMQNDEGKRQVKRFASETPGLRIFDSKKEYLAKVRGFFGVGENAFTLLNRAAGLKQIYSIDQIFREFVLDDLSVFGRAREVVAEFDNLQAIYEELEIARRQRDALQRVDDAEKKRQRVLKELADLAHLKGILPRWFATAAVALWEQEVLRLKAREDEIQRRLNDLNASEKTQQDTIETLTANYQKLGGSQIQNIEQAIEFHTEKLKQVLRNAADYQRLASGVGLDDAIDEGVFHRNKAAVPQLLAEAEETLEAARQARNEVSGLLHNQRAEQEKIEAEIRQVTEQENSIPGNFHAFRELLAERLDVPAEGLPYVAELIEVKPEESDWQGAIERAVGAERLRILVPERLVQRALEWVNSRDNKLHVRIQSVSDVVVTAQVFPDSFIHKLNFKQHAFTDYVRSFLAQRDLHCVQSVEELRRTEHAMTIEGTMSSRKGRFDKQDQRALSSDWMIGFSNKHRLEALTQKFTELKAAIDELAGKEAGRIRDEDARRNVIAAIQQLEQIEYSAVYAAPLEKELESLQSRLAALIDPDSDTAKAKEALEKAKVVLGEMKQESSRITRELGACEIEHKQARHAHEAALRSKGDGLTQSDLALAEREFPIAPKISASQVGEAENHAAAALGNRMKTAEKKQSDIERDLSNLMLKAKQVDTGALVDATEHLEDVGLYLERLRLLMTEALPEKLGRFRQYLNKSSGQGVSQLLSSVEAEVRSIETRIHDLNNTLRRVDYRNGNYLQLVPEHIVHESIRQVGAAMQRLRRDELTAVDDEGDALFHALKNVIELIRVAVESKQNKGSLALFDPRYRLQFFVKEVNRETGASFAKRSGSQTGSGGEKEMMASFILTASLSYTLSSQDAVKPRHSTIVLDEAFSKSSRTAAARIIEALRIFGLHPIFVTPNKEVMLLKHHTGSAVVVHHKGGSSSLSSLTWEELENRHNEIARNPSQQT